MYFDAMYSSMPRITVNVSEETEDWLEAEADALGVSKARVGGHCIEVMQSTVDHINLQQQAVDSVATGDDVDAKIEEHFDDVRARLDDELRADVLERLDELEDRVDDLEERDRFGIAQSGLSEPPADESAARQPPEETAPEPVSPTQPPDESEDVDPIGDALEGWSYGRTDEEQDANDSVARASLEWLRDEADGVVRQSDLPLDELAEDDPLGRKPDTLWRSVIRGAWQHATGQGYVGKPDSRGYEWAR